MHYFGVVTDDGEFVFNPLLPPVGGGLDLLVSLRGDVTRRLDLSVGIDLKGLVTFERRCLADTDVQMWKG